ncbi:MAG: hypothetical protein ACF8OB_10160 [Phycisphaeraceae bacterium JB051]
MNPLPMASVIVAWIKQHAQANPLLGDIASNLFVERVPQHVTLPYLHLSMNQADEVTYATQASDTQVQMQMTLVGSLSDGAAELSDRHEALVLLLDQKQLVLQHQSRQRLLHCWLERIKDIDIEHDRIKLTSVWQLRCV